MERTMRWEKVVATLRYHDHLLHGLRILEELPGREYGPVIIHVYEGAIECMNGRARVSKIFL